MHDSSRYSAVLLRSAEDTLAADVRRGLTFVPKALPCKYFYDPAGMALYDKICELPEYYLTRTETAILQREIDALLSLCPPDLTLVELGAGCGPKTRLLIEACLRRQGSLDYWGLDLAADALEQAAAALLRDFPSLHFLSLAGDFTDGLNYLAQRDGPPRLVAFLGSTIGNLDEQQIHGFFALLHQALRPQDRFLLGFDLRKDPPILVAAYDDAQGVTAAFNRNLLVRINRELLADFDVAAFAHRAVFNSATSRIEMQLVSLREQTVHIGALDLGVSFHSGEAIHTENCYKHSPAAMSHLLARHGLRVVKAVSDPR